jgi:hypothetical protein
MIDRHLQAVLRWAKETRDADGRRAIDRRVRIAGTCTPTSTRSLANWQVAPALTDGDSTPPTRRR